MLRRISETSDRKVSYASRPVTGADAPEKKPAAADGAPLAKQDSTSTKDKESDPAAAAEINKDAADSLSTIQPPKKSATQ
jgi:hypothetical protein